jgi:hypothetical protein
MRRARSYLTVISFASFVAALLTAESLSRGACQGDWFDGDCYHIGSRTCRECLYEDAVFLGFTEGKCEDIRCVWQPGFVCPTAYGIVYTNNLMTTPCDCNGDDGPGFDAYETVKDEDGNDISKHCADLYNCSPIFGCENIMGVQRCRQDANHPLPTKLTCLTYQLAGGGCSCNGG